MRLKLFTIALLMVAAMGHASAQKFAIYGGLGLAGYMHSNAAFGGNDELNYYNMDERFGTDGTIGFMLRPLENSGFELQLGLSDFLRYVDMPAPSGALAKAKEHYVALDLMLNGRKQSRYSNKISYMMGVGLQTSCCVYQLVALHDMTTTERHLGALYTKFAPKLQLGVRYALSPRCCIQGSISSAIELKQLSITRLGLHNSFFLTGTIGASLIYTLGGATE